MKKSNSKNNLRYYVNKNNDGSMVYSSYKKNPKTGMTTSRDVSWPAGGGKKTVRTRSFKSGSSRSSSSSNSSGGKSSYSAYSSPSGNSYTGGSAGSLNFINTMGLLKQYKHGGKVKKTGPAFIHKGERILNKKQAQKFEKIKKKVFGIKKYGKN